MRQVFRASERAAANAARARVSALRRRRGWVPRVPAREFLPADAVAELGSEQPERRAVPRHRSMRRPPDGLVALVREVGDGVRFRLESGHAVVVVLVATLAVGASLLFLRAAQADVEPVGMVRPSVVSTGTPAPGGSAEGPADGSAGPSPAMVLVHVAGRVNRPGVIRLPSGARVIDAIEAAGGADVGVDLTALNLARVLSDGEQVLVGVDPPPGSTPSDPAAGAGAGDGSGSGPVNLNTATREQLESLPGVGPVLAQRIIDWREENGRFTSLDELREISGIGPRIFERLAGLVRL